MCPQTGRVSVQTSQTALASPNNAVLWPVNKPLCPSSLRQALVQTFPRCRPSAVSAAGPRNLYERDVGLFRTRSALIGAIWQVQDNIAVDLGFRGARVNDHSAGEIRAGVTFAFGVTKGPDILSGRIATTLPGIQRPR